MDRRLFTLINAAQHRMFKFAELESEKRAALTVTQSAALMFIAKPVQMMAEHLSYIYQKKVVKSSLKFSPW